MNIGQKYIITTDQWFIGPDGNQYRAAFGTVHGVHDSADVLGVRTNAKSTNWYVVIGDMVLAGCQIHYAVRTDQANFAQPTWEGEKDGQCVASKAAMTRIYNADASGLVPTR
ncbi:MAG: hypothetical protein Tp176DCM1853251_49 [Prokaryotic dsDNA virus sp.]|nr:MAG: hypothetical protein Tp176DCM1853251_49 [Prokaryotic dsDNA virus sp.]|tara:strand:+ start:282 stop:617 length:336 start_codon:yes stop_codon:yes gene_type:complete